jgi:hypothetical protein
VFAVILLCPAIAYAQGAVTGVVRDTSGAVLPGVTVEGASLVLIEKVRAVVSDGTGQYCIENVGPGIYTLTFTLPDFATVRREGIEFTGSLTATVNGELRVDAVEETVTVTGESPVVDVQTTTRQRVMNREVLDSIPSGGSAYTLAVLIPGMSSGGATQNVGSVESRGTGGLGGGLTIHGRGSTSITMSGINITTQGSSGTTATIRPNPAAIQKITLDTSAVSAELFGGGVRINHIPKEGGNSFNAILIASVADGRCRATTSRRSWPAAGCGHRISSIRTGTSIPASAARS